MTKKEFLHTLSRKLSLVHPKEREETIGYYAELIDDMMEEGYAEEEAVGRLEDIDVIAQRILDEKEAQTPTPQPAPAKGSGCLRGCLIAAVTLIIVTLILSYAGVAVVGKVFDGLLPHNIAGTGELKLEEEIASSIDITEKGVEIRQGDFELSINEEEGVHISGQLPQNWSEWQEGLDRLAEWQNSSVPAEMNAEHVLCDLPANGIRSLSVEWVSASVEFRTHEKDTVLAIEYSAEALTAEQVGLARKDGSELEIDFDNDVNRGSYPHKKLVVWLPAGMELDELSAEAASADITVAGIGGRELEVDTASGNIIIEGVWRGIETDTASGNVTLSPGPDFKLHFETASGSMDRGSYDLQQKKNNYTAGAGTAVIKVNTASGDLTLK